MPEIVDHVAYLSQEIGPRPAGTEEEQQAALYITEQIQKDAGLPAVIEDFGGAADADLPRMICCGCTLVFAALSLFVPVLGIPAVIVAFIAGALFVAEALHKPVLSKVFARGVSQNVVAKYEPGYSAEKGGTRRRKVILVSRYDSGKVRAELNTPVVGILPILQWVVLGAMALTPVLLLIRTVFFQNAGGTGDVVLKVLIAIALVATAIPLVFGILHKTASFNEGANCNASGTAVLLEVARRIGRGRVSEAELAARAEADIHGEEAAREAGLVPEGAELVYEAQQVKAPEIAPQTPEARLAAAKAAVAALTGKSVNGAYAADLSQNLVQVKEPPVPHPTEEDLRELNGETREAFATIPADTVQEALAKAEAEAHAAADLEADAHLAAAGVAAAAVAAVPVERPAGGVPDWFKKAQEKAKKPRAEKPVQRSRYASALDAAVSESAGHFAEASAIVDHKLEESLDAGREEIHEIKAPQWFTQPQGEPVSSPQADAAGLGDQPAAQSAEVAASVPAQSVAADAAEAAAAHPRTAEPLDLPVFEDPFSTSAMAPIDVSDLHLHDVPPMKDLPMPSFLDPRKVQEEARAQREADHRTGDRVDVTDAAIDPSGRVDYVQPATPEQPMPVEQAEQADDQLGKTVAHAPIVLPDIGVSAAKPAPITELPKQRAPLADVETSGKSAAKSLLSMLPSINVEGESADETPVDGTAGAISNVDSNKKASLKAMLPSLSGAISRASSNENRSTNVAAAGSFVPAGATGSFAPVGDELLENVDPDDIYVDDADDSAYDGNFTESGAFAGPGYVEMPKSRVHRLFDRFRKKNKAEEPTPQEWLEVDESFEARAVGAQRGGWESFRGEDGTPALGDPSATVQMDAYDNAYDAYDTYEDDGYDQPAYLGQDEGFAPVYPPQNQGFAPVNGFDNAGFDEDDDFDMNDVDELDDFNGKGRSRWQGGAFSTRRMESSDLASEDIAEESAHAAAPEEAVAEELKQIYQFRNPDIDTEVWFVALGSELAQNAGMNAFLAEHQQDLRGSIIIDLDALGAGELCMLEQEGEYKPVKTSSRMKRYTKKASQATGLSVGTARLQWEESAASFAIRHGFQAMHLVGMDGRKPALYGQADDVLENIDEETLRANADFVMELLKNI